MEATKLDTIWKLGSLVILTIGFALMLIGVIKLDLDSTKCIDDPFKYGSKELIDYTDYSHLNCDCQISDKWKGSKKFSFNEISGIFNEREPSPEFFNITGLNITLGVAK